MDLPRQSASQCCLDVAGRRQQDMERSLRAVAEPAHHLDTSWLPLGASPCWPP